MLWIREFTHERKSLEIERTGNLGVEERGFGFLSRPVQIMGQGDLTEACRLSLTSWPMNESVRPTE